jgi:hypothetical protein
MLTARDTLPMAAESWLFRQVNSISEIPPFLFFRYKYIFFLAVVAIGAASCVHKPAKQRHRAFFGE